MVRERKYPFKLLPKYPGMRPQDEVIWDEFVKNNPNVLDEVWYDVHVGDPCVDEQVREKMKESGAYEVSQWCIDVVGKMGSQIFVIEVKPNARAGALGQALAYKKLLEIESFENSPIHPVVLTDEIQPITLQAATMLGVALWTP